MPKPAKEKKSASKKQDRQGLQEKYLELQVLKQQISNYVEQKQAVDVKINELNASIEALKALPNVKKGEEMWSSLGSGTFVRSDIKDVEKVLVAIGAGVVTRETLPKAIEILESRAKELSDINDEIIRQANTMVERINQLEPEVSDLSDAE